MKNTTTGIYRTYQKFLQPILFLSLRPQFQLDVHPKDGVRHSVILHREELVPVENVVDPRFVIDRERIVPYVPKLVSLVKPQTAVKFHVRLDVAHDFAGFKEEFDFRVGVLQKCQPGKVENLVVLLLKLPLERLLPLRLL